MWCETTLYRNHHLTDDETVEFLKRDFKLANLLGFKALRTKLTVQNQNCDPEPGWEKYIGTALEWAEKYDVRMCSEVHRPTVLTAGHIQDYLRFIERTGTKYFGFNVDFGTFQNRDPEGFIPTAPRDSIKGFSKPEDILLVLPYTYCCHAKFNYMDENFEEITIPYKDVLNIMFDYGWSGPMVSEYEGPRRDEYEFLGDQLRRHHILLKNMLGH
jgi:sugar phosphate isomerase/epimerase